MRDHLFLRIAQALPTDLPRRLGVAVSGGGDSMALLHLLHRHASELGIEILAATVDHGLRPEARQEAALVAEQARKLGFSHEILLWTGWDGTGNLQDSARSARYRLIGDWARRRNIPAVAFGHTLDDQAETVVMRLARGSGVDGLSAMRPVSRRDELQLLRPLLDVRREELRAFLRAEGVPWRDDPSNEDDGFARIRVRKAMEALSPLGVTQEALAQVARNMQMAQHVLALGAMAAARSCLTLTAGAVVLEAEPFDALPDETARRLLLAALKWTAGGAYAPRSKAVGLAIAAVRSAGSATLDGCRLLRQKSDIWIFREWNAVRSLRCCSDALWDGRWRLAGPDADGDAEVGALGEEGLAQCPDWRATGLPRDLLLASPAAWRGGNLVAAPLAGCPNGWSATVVNGDMTGFLAQFSH